MVYGSDYTDIDRYFGSFGSVLTEMSAIYKIQQGGSFEVNLMHYGPFHPVIVRHLIDNVLGTTKNDVILYVSYDSSTDKRTYSDEPLFVTYRRYDIKQDSDGLELTSKSFLVLKSKSATSPIVDEAEIVALLASMPKVERFTIPILTRYEKAVAIAKRSEHLALGAQPTIVVPADELDVLTVAEMELEAKKMPILIIRPDGAWDINELMDYEAGGYRY
jgi:DNA-directed RNA polymerase subunit K/omega